MESPCYLKKKRGERDRSLVLKPVAKKSSHAKLTTMRLTSILWTHQEACNFFFVCFCLKLRKFFSAPMNNLWAAWLVIYKSISQANMARGLKLLNRKTAVTNDIIFYNIIITNYSLDKILCARRCSVAHQRWIILLTRSCLLSRPVWHY